MTLRGRLAWEALPSMVVLSWSPGTWWGAPAQLSDLSLHLYSIPHAEDTGIPPRERTQARRWGLDIPQGLMPPPATRKSGQDPPASVGCESAH